MSKKKIVALATTMVLIISLIPIVVISKYNVPYYDDYNHGYLIYQAINNGNSIINNKLSFLFDNIKSSPFDFIVIYFILKNNN